MHISIGDRTLELVRGDITLQDVDAIVNAANSALAGGVGVDGAIHRRGGPSIMEETRRRYPDGCPTGSAVITGGGNLTARHVIHAVGPIWREGSAGEAGQLAAAYRRSFELAEEQACESIALPALSTGAYRFPLPQAAEIALSTAIEFLGDHARPSLIRFVLFDDKALEAFIVALESLQAAD